MIVRTAWVIASFLLALFAGGELRAQEPQLGETALGLPGIARVGVPVPRAPHVGIAATGSFGYTEAMPDKDEASTGLGGRLGFAAYVVPNLALSLDSGLRFDSHGDLPSQIDAADDLGLTARYAAKAGEQGYLGAELGARVPSGEELGLAFDALSLEAKLLAAFVPDPTLTVATSLGYRFDRSEHAVDDPSTLSPADRITLGASELDAFLLGVGFSKRFHSTELLGELSADVWLGTSSDDVSTSPVRVLAGVRQHLGQSVQLELLAEGVLSSRPPLGTDDPLIRVPPRLWASLGVRIVLPGAQAIATSAEVAPAPAKAAPADASVVAPIPAPEPEPEPQAPAVAPAATPAPAPSAETASQIRGHIRSLSGEPLAATITLSPGGGKASTNAEGFFQIDVPPGRYSLRLRSFGYKSQSRVVLVDPNGVTVLNAELGKK